MNQQLLSSAQKEARKRQHNLRLRRLLSQSYLWLLLIILYAPILLIIIFSFTKSKVFGNWTGFTFALYENLFTGYDHVAQVHVDPNLYHSIFYTVIIALIAATIATLLGTLAAIGIYNMRQRDRKIVQFMNSIPMINPDILTGISLFLLFVFLGISRGLTTVIIAHVVFCTPYVVLSVMPRLSKMNPNIYEAALDLGATPFQALRKVMMPELWPGMLSGFILSVTLSIDDFGVTFFTKGSGGLNTLSTFIYADARKGGLTPELRPLFSLIFITMFVLLVIINWRASRQAKTSPKKH
ncbi:MAG: ABC transporter permease [Paludibacter sp.]|nr:ABC transporter permease [Bacteroidales bacterium]MCM1068598.1 ABC transporter permease [Prevotella sp.]MCM1353262.1 ABC transporter permease [Bacteroides sp.]MCM1442330.1 ABC transporter permease [Muribaculum sp.]MCM1481149.1 ABC transporter permease [Paludibacter sp.]